MFGHDVPWFAGLNVRDDKFYTEVMVSTFLFEQKKKCFILSLYFT